MSDPTQTVKILVVTAADTSGLKQLSDAFKEVADAAKKAAPATNETLRDGIAADGSRLKQNREQPDQFQRELPRAEHERPEEATPRRESARNDSHLRPSTAAAESADPGDAVDKTEAQTNHAHVNENAADHSDKFANSPDSAQSDTASQAAEAMAHGRNVDAGAQTLIRSLANILQTTHGNLQDILSLIKDGQRNAAVVAREINDLKRSLGELQRRGSTPPPAP